MGVESSEYALGGSGFSGFDTSTASSTLVVTRQSNSLRYYFNGFNFFLVPDLGQPGTGTDDLLTPATITLFLRQTKGQTDSHLAVFKQLKITAAQFIPEPTSVALAGLAALCAPWYVRGSRLRRVDRCDSLKA
jgi:hypothetical protein